MPLEVTSFIRDRLVTINIKIGIRTASYRFNNTQSVEFDYGGRARRPESPDDITYLTKGEEEAFRELAVKHTKILANMLPIDLDMSAEFPPVLRLLAAERVKLLPPTE